MKKLHILAMAACAAAVSVIPASAQNVNGRPNFGQVNLRSGFAPDPRVISVVSGGNINASRVRGSGTCRGFISATPDVRLVYTASGRYPLIISVDSSADTTLIVNTPNGRFICDDDGGERGLNPSIRINNPGSGRYEIWVGSYRAGTNSRARLHISEVSSQ
ncbi:MAG TPA: hypothetical protein VMG08_10480 [Allosphingosinicella sp.]|nr:hypothetical protein [Allosphingosinicella sp.]